jgi:hypothetical protein
MQDGSKADAPYPERKKPMMTKGELRKARKAAAAAGKDWRTAGEWTAEALPEGGYSQVRTRSAAAERRHERAMERWARRMDSDADWRG